MHRHHYKEAIKLYQEALNVYPGHEKSLYNLTLALIKCGRWKEASENADLLILKYAYNESYLNLKGFISIKQNKYQEAKAVLFKALEIAPNDRNSAINLGVVLSMTGKHGFAENLLKRAEQIYPRDLAIQFGLIENSLRARDEMVADDYLEELLAEFNVNDIIDYLVEMAADNTMTPLSPEFIAPAVGDRLKKSSESFKLLYSPEN